MKLKFHKVSTNNYIAKADGTSASGGVKTGDKLYRITFRGAAEGWALSYQGSELRRYVTLSDAKAAANRHAS